MSTGDEQTNEDEAATEAQQEIRTVIAQMLDVDHLPAGDVERVQAARESEWLVKIYESRRSLLEGDLDRSWSILQLFVPLSLAPFAGVVIVDSLDVIHVLLLGLASIALLLFAVFHVERMKSYYDWTWQWVKAVEAEVGLPSRHYLTRQRPRFNMRKLNRAMIGVAVALWLTLLLAVSLGSVGS